MPIDGIFASKYGAVTPDAFRFFLENAGWSAPPGRVVCAADLAQAERSAWSADLICVWELEDTCYCSEDDIICACDRGRLTDAARSRAGHYSRGWECHCEHATVFHRGEWEDYDRATGPLASLGGICGADANYRRVVAAELYAEALEALRAQDGAQDARRGARSDG